MTTEQEIAVTKADRRFDEVLKAIKEHQHGS